MRPTARGLGLTAVGGALAVIAAGIEDEDLARIAALLLGLAAVSLTAMIVIRLCGLTTRVHRVVDPARPVVGQWATVLLRIAKGQLGMWSRLRERTPREVPRSAVTSETEGRWKYQIMPGQRGYLRLGPSTVVHQDPLGLLRWRVPGDRGEPILVWPRTVALPPFRRFQELSGSAAAPFGLPERSVEDLTVREYVQGDDLRRVHWRSSARRGSLMVRSDEPTHPDTLDLLVDVKQGAGAEWAVSAIASLAIRLLTDDVPVRLHACRKPGPSAPPEVSSQPCTDPATALDVLAATAVTPPSLREQIRTAAASAGPCLIAVLQQPDAALLTGLSRLPRHRKAFALIVSERSDAPSSLDGMVEQGWAVHVACPEGDLSGIARAWQTLLEPVPVR
ncbi:MAG TPA: DUF58 domain-containing protein [Beutenbergiaceae bacterium]|nr:DUF58 domain-containing protein [Beutenbergiaceae bacterium]